MSDAGSPEDWARYRQQLQRWQDLVTEHKAELTRLRVLAKHHKFHRRKVVCIPAASADEAIRLSYADVLNNLLEKLQAEHKIHCIEAVIGRRPQSPVEIYALNYNVLRIMSGIPSAPSASYSPYVRYFTTWNDYKPSWCKLGHVV